MEKKSSAPTEVATTYFVTDRDLGKMGTKFIYSI